MKPALLLICAATCLVLALSPSVAQAQAAEQAPRVVRARIGERGGSVALENLRLLAPPGALPPGAFLALGVRGVPVPPEWPAGTTRLTVSTSGPPRAPLTLVIQPQAADLAVAAGDRARLVLRNTATGESFGCRADAGTLSCVIRDPGMYALVVGEATLLAEPAPVSAPAGGGRRLGVVLAGVAAAAVAAVIAALLWRETDLPHTRQASRRP